MNLRIQELAKQAGVYFGEAHKDYFGEEHPAYVSTRDIDVEKFAELIVRECMTQIEEVKQIKAGHAGPEYTQGFDDGMFVAIRTIEEHFGVEE